MPSRKIFRSSTTSSKSIGILLSALSKKSATPAFPMRATPPAGGGEPFQIKSSPFLPRRDFMDCSPKTQRMDSAILDFPEPFGPTTAVILDGNSSMVERAKDLKPEISTFFKCIIVCAFYNFYYSRRKTLLYILLIYFRGLSGY